MDLARVHHPGHYLMKVCFTFRSKTVEVVFVSQMSGLTLKVWLSLPRNRGTFSRRRVVEGTEGTECALWQTWDSGLLCFLLARESKDESRALCKMFVPAVVPK